MEGTMSLLSEPTLRAAGVAAMQRPAQTQAENFFDSLKELIMGAKASVPADHQLRL